MSLYKRANSQYWWIRLPPIKGELKPLQISTGTTNKRQAQQYHDKLKAERWEQEKLDIKPQRMWDEAAERFLQETTHKRTQAWDKSMLGWFHPYLGGKALDEINRALLDEVKAKRAKGVAPATVNRYMALVRAILRRACFEWEWLDRVPKVGMLRDKGGRIRALTKEEFARLLEQLPSHLRDMAVFSVATGLRQGNVTKLQWRQISLERQHLWIAAEDHKNGKPHAVPLNEAAMQVLHKRMGDHPTHVFTYEGNPIIQVNTKAWRAAIPKKRGAGLTRPGPLYPLLALPLSGVTEDTLKVWFDREAKAGKHQAARALMMFRGFLRWCASQPEYRALVDREAGKAPAIVQNLPATTRRTDALEAAQVAGWWAGVEQLSNYTASAYLRALLLTGARREEMASLRWSDVDFRWRKLTLADKVDVSRTIPLGPYLQQLISSLPRIGEYVFASTGREGRIVDLRSSHAKVLQSAGVEHLTFHGLRRRFSLLGEAAGAPAGAIAQVMGHKPSATAEGYRPRSMDALRPFLERIEAYILEQAGVQREIKAEVGKLRAVL